MSAILILSTNKTVEGIDLHPRAAKGLGEVHLCGLPDTNSFVVYVHILIACTYHLTDYFLGSVYFR